MCQAQGLKQPSRDTLKKAMAAKAPAQDRVNEWMIEAYVHEVTAVNPGMEASFCRNDDGTFNSVIFVMPGAKDIFKASTQMAFADGAHMKHNKEYAREKEGQGIISLLLASFAVFCNAYVIV